MNLRITGNWQLAIGNWLTTKSELPKAISRCIAGACLVVGIVPAAHAQRTLTVNIGTALSFDEIASNAASFLFYAIEFLAVALFVVGALLFTLSRGKDDMVQKGKSLMVESMIGLAVVLAAHAILSTVLYVLYS